MKKNRTNETKNDFQDFLSLVPPKRLQKSINEVFFGFLIHSDGEIPKNFNVIAEDIYLLLKFLEGVDSNVVNK